MLDESLNINELIKIEQMPKVFEQLETIGKWVDNGIEKLNLKDLVYDEEHKSEIKKLRTEVNNISKMLETKRKEIKNNILEPYNIFEEKYNKEIKTKLLNAYEQLGNGIEAIENKQKLEKENKLREFFNRYQETYHFEKIINFEDVGLNITLSASETSLKEQIIKFFEKVSNDFMAIQSEENNREELFIEYKNNGFDYAKAIITINERNKRIKELEESIKTKENIENEEQKVIENIKTLVSSPEKIETIECQFVVKTTKEKIMKLKDFMKKEGIEYK